MGKRDVEQAEDGWLAELAHDPDPARSARAWRDGGELDRSGEEFDLAATDPGRLASDPATTDPFGFAPLAGSGRPGGGSDVGDHGDAGADERADHHGVEPDPEGLGLGLFDLVSTRATPLRAATPGVEPAGNWDADRWGGKPAFLALAVLIALFVAGSGLVLLQLGDDPSPAAAEAKPSLSNSTKKAAPTGGASANPEASYDGCTSDPELLAAPWDFGCTDAPNYYSSPSPRRSSKTSKRPSPSATASPTPSAKSSSATAVPTTQSAPVTNSPTTRSSPSPKPTTTQPSPSPSPKPSVTTTKPSASPSPSASISTSSSPAVEITVVVP